MATAICTVNNLATPQNVAAGVSFEVELANPSGLDSWTLTCLTTDETNTPAAVNATIVINNISKKATVTAPGQGSAMLFQSQIDGGNTDSQVDPAKTVTFAVFVLCANGNRVMAPGMTYEPNATYGWAPDINKLLRGTTVGIVGASPHTMQSNADVASASDNAAPIVDFNHGAETADWTFQFATPATDKVILVTNNTAFNGSISQPGQATPTVIGPGIFAFVRLKASGTAANAVNGGTT